MSIKLSDLVLMSDVDGTLVTRDMALPERNLEALRRFVDKGGRFGLSTGRAMDFGREMITRLPVNFPCVFSNGGVIYDVETDSVIYDEYLPDDAGRFARVVAARFPGARLVVQAQHGYYNVSDFGVPDREKRYDESHMLAQAPLDEVPGRWHKVLFIIEAAQRDESFDFVQAQRFPGTRLVSTNEIMHEMLPETCSKGNALRRLLALRGLRREQLCCIGDYYNDLEMIELAGIGVTLRTSPEEIRAAAQLVVGPVEQGALADLVEELERRFES